MVDVVKKQDELSVKSDYHTAHIKALAAVVMDVNGSLTVHKMDTDKKFENVDKQPAEHGSKLDLILSLLQNRNGH